MPTATSNFCGKYLGRNRVRPGHEDELSSTERKQLEKAPTVDLHLREDGTFTKQITEGTWTVERDRVILKPIRFGGKSEAEMREAAEAMGRTFGLKFVFYESELLVCDDKLTSPDDRAVIFTEFTRA
jgi:hypothetical protein